MPSFCSTAAVKLSYSLLLVKAQSRNEQLKTLTMENK